MAEKKDTKHSAKAQGTRGRRSEKARDNRGADGKKKKHKALSGDTEIARHKGGGATTRVQPTARQATQNRRERKESREARGQQNKPHTAPGPRAGGA